MHQTLSAHSRLISLVAAASVALLSGCAINMKVPVKDPAPSAAKYEQPEKAGAKAFYFKDDQTAAIKGNILGGTIPMQMTYMDKPFDAAPWVAKHTVADLVARGAAASLAQSEANATTVSIKQIHVENHRVSGYSPFVTFTSVSADLMLPSGPQRITAYVKRGKVPVWSFDEIIEPTFNEPLNLLTKELAAKINQNVFKLAASDKQVADLVALIAKDAGTRESAYMDVYQLGFSNNKTAIPELVKLSKHSSEYIRLAAISSLGIIRAVDQFGLLVQLYETKGGLWQDRAMALKAIGDLGTPESRAYLQKEWAAYEKLTDKEATWNKAILSLYL